MRSRFARYAYGWITLTLFLSTLAGHFTLAMLNGDPVSKWAQDFLENMQSEMAQLLWQVIGLAWFLQAGSPSSRESDDRQEAKKDAIMRALRLDDELERIDREFLRDKGWPRRAPGEP